jgi:ParB family chromosome partitioning protein
MGHARALINIDNIDLQLEVYKKAVEEELSVRKVEELVRNLAKPKKPVMDRADVPAEHQAELKKVESRLSSHFGTKIYVKTSSEGKGEIKIPFVSTDDLNRILELLNY